MAASESANEHRRTGIAAVRCAVLTVSDTRTPATDTSGSAIVDLLQGAGHTVAHRDLLPDEPARVQTAVRGWIGSVEVIVTTGGTGITSRDSTYEALCSLFDQRLDGFGELFRALSFQDIGSAAMLSRATAGISGRTAIFLLPGSEHAVRLGMTRLIAPELGHLVRELRR